MDDEAQIKALLEARIAAMAGKDGAAAVAMLDPGLVAFEMAGPLQVPAAQAADAAATQAWLDGFDGPVEVEMRDLRIETGGDVAFCHSLSRLRATGAEGRVVDIWMRSTFGLRRSDEGWRIVHAHTSVPMRTDGSFAAALDLKP